jgi:hypothetical protein
MSSYGPAGGYPGQPDQPHPQQPWDPYQQSNPYGGGQPPHQQGGQGPYGPPPADPWGQGQGSWADLTTPQPRYGGPAEPPTQAYGETTYQQPYADAYGQPYQQQYEPDGPHWDEPPPRRTGLTVALAVTAVVVLAVAVGVTLFLVSGGDEGQPATAPGTEQPDPGATGEDEAPGPDAPPEDRIGLSATEAVADDCLVNDADNADPQMRIVACDADEEGPVYRVLERFDQRVSGDAPAEQDQSAQQICSQAEGYEFFYRFVGPTEDESFVLCLVQH